MHVVIIGGGPGGLTLAQGLKKAGVGVALYEKSVVRADYVQGFRMRIQQHGLDALRSCLPPHLFDAFEATVGRSPAQSLQFDEHLTPLPSLEAAAPQRVRDGHDQKSVSRITLRQVLLTELDDIVHTERVFTRYDVNADGSVTAWFEDGTSVEADLLVGADGVASRVRGQLLPHATHFDTGARRLAGKITLADAERLGIAEMFFTHNVGIKSEAGPRLGVSVHRVDPDGFARYGLVGADDPSHRGIAGSHFDNTTSYIWWNIAFPKDELGPDETLFALDGAGLLEALGRRVADWHPEIVKLLTHSDPTTVAVLRVRSSQPVEPWTSGPVTLLGDAIHSMTYFRALGGNSALRDAGILTAQLAEVKRGSTSLGDAVAAYEDAMREHGYEAVRSSLAALERSLAPLAA